MKEDYPHWQPRSKSKSSSCDSYEILREDKDYVKVDRKNSKKKQKKIKEKYKNEANYIKIIMTNSKRK